MNGPELLCFPNRVVHILPSNSHPLISVFLVFILSNFVLFSFFVDVLYITVPVQLVSEAHPTVNTAKCFLPCTFASLHMHRWVFLESEAFLAVNTLECLFFYPVCVSK